MDKSIKEDLYRYVGGYSVSKCLKTYFFIPGFRYMYWFRLASKNPKNIFYKLIHRKLSYKFGIQIPIGTKIGRGFYIGHYNCIVVNQGAIIGDNVNISHGVTIGQVNVGDKEGAPIIGNNVYIGPGAKIVGAIKIGNNVAIGANAVVVKDVEDNCIVGGIPAKVLSMKGSKGYVNRTV
ncbi:serine O-acetyltransferase [Myroides odoratimimus]|uniref:serine O-acetyltransferase n=1 Tax=Myroides odoratimimus TaxID=76832 RepID=UPI00217F51DC|nr:serine O-acetyltransferase [Myroides odoratimimus]MCS7474893.1 serine O-acetyltransferase [Myroides odoratimimus]